jgi:hypothetical protein
VVADQDDHGQRAGKQIQQSYKSAPPKIVYKEAEKPKFMHDAQKSYNRHINMDDNEKVHIPNTMEESESDSESFTLKVQQLTGMEDVAQSKPKSGQGESSKQMWRMETMVNELDPKEHLKNKKVDDIVSPMVTTDKLVEEISPIPPTSPKVFITYDNIVNTQESVGIDICDTTVNDGGGVMRGDDRRWERQVSAGRTCRSC